MLKMRLAHEHAEYVGLLFDIDDVSGSEFLQRLPSFTLSLPCETVAALSAVRSFLTPHFENDTLVYVTEGEYAGRIGTVVETAATMTNKICDVALYGLVEAVYVDERLLEKLAVGAIVSFRLGALWIVEEVEAFEAVGAVEGPAAAQAEPEGSAADDSVEGSAAAQAEAEGSAAAVEVEAVVHRGVRALYTDNAEFFARFDGVGIANHCGRAGSVARHVGLYIH
jgi:hypothetical protein